MRGGRRATILIVVGAALVVLAVILATQMFRSRQLGRLAGAVLISDPDPRDQLPISGVRISAVSGFSKGYAVSDSSGGFRLELKPPVLLGRMITLGFRQSDYHPVDLEIPAQSRILVVRLTPIQQEPSLPYTGPISRITNVQVRYATRIVETATVGSAVKTFLVVNTGNVPCNGRQPCSPDGKWKAAIGGVALDAGRGNVFGHVRVSCMAGPCPFAAIEQDHFSRGGPHISVSVRNWSDTVTYLVEAEVFRTMVSDAIRRFYPVILGRTMSFTLPADSQGLSVEADVNGRGVVFPLGPALRLSWAECEMKLGPDRTKTYRCELKPGYEFR